VPQIIFISRKVLTRLGNTVLGFSNSFERMKRLKGESDQTFSNECRSLLTGKQTFHYQASTKFNLSDAKSFPTREELATKSRVFQQNRFQRATNQKTKFLVSMQTGQWLRNVENVTGICSTEIIFGMDRGSFYERLLHRKQRLATPPLTTRHVRLRNIRKRLWRCYNTFDK